MTVEHSVKQAAIDAGTAGGVISMPLWVQQMEGWIQFVLYIGGALLLGFRIWLAFKEHRRLSAKDVIETIGDN